MDVWLEVGRIKYSFNNFSQVGERIVGLVDRDFIGKM